MVIMLIIVDGRSVGIPIEFEQMIHFGGQVVHRVDGDGTVFL